MQWYLTFKAWYRIILTFHVDNNNDTTSKVVIVSRLFIECADTLLFYMYGFI